MMKKLNRILEGYSYAEPLYKTQCYMEGLSTPLYFPEHYNTKSASNICKNHLFKTDKNTNSFNEVCSKFGGFLCSR